MDHYATLGIHKSASTDDIKAAFKKLALQYHPDKGGDSKHFAKITEAYDVLSNADKRHEYDNPTDFNFTTDDIFSQWVNKQRYHRNQNIKITYSIDFIDQFTGKTTSISYKLPNGNTKEVVIKIPKGITHGQQLTFSKLGDDTNPYIKPGSLILDIKVKNDTNWSRDGNDIRTSIDINVFDLILGTTIHVNLPTEQKFKLNIKPGTKPNTVLNIPEYGVPHLSTGLSGNVLIKLNAVIPEITDNQILNQIEKIRDTIGWKKTLQL